MRAGICCLNFPLPKKKKVEPETRSWEQVVYVKSDPRKYQKRSGRTVSEAREANYSIFNEEVTDWPIEAHSSGDLLRNTV